MRAHANIGSQMLATKISRNISDHVAARAPHHFKIRRHCGTLDKITTICDYAD
jgi:hypothetical protein